MCSAIRSVLGEKHIDYAAGLNNLAVLYWTTGAYDKAEPIYLECMGFQLKECQYGDPPVRAGAGV
jgi:hypothetical protein